MTNENEMNEMTEIDETEVGSEVGGNEGDDLENWEASGEASDEVVHHGEIVSHEEADHALSVNGNSAEAFYATVGEEVAEELRSAATDARLKMLDSFESAVEAGRILNRVRGLLSEKRGQFTKWLSVEFGKTDRTARNFMSLATSVDDARLLGPDTSHKVLELPQATLYKLGAETLPDEDRREIIQDIGQGKYEKASDVLDAINERKEAEAERRGGKKGDKKAATGGEGEGDGAEETFQEKKEKYATALRRHFAFMLASGIVTDEVEDGISVGDIVSLYGEIRKKLTAEDHAMVSEMLFTVAKAFQKGGMDAVTALKPVVPEEPVSKAKAKKKATGGDD